MTDLQRDIGGLEARMDEHEKRVDRIEQKIDEGFEAVNTRLDLLTESENRRKGALVALRVLLGSGVIAAIVEGARALLGR